MYIRIINKIKYLKNIVCFVNNLSSFEVNISIEPFKQLNFIPSLSGIDIRILQFKLFVLIIHKMMKLKLIYLFIHQMQV